MTLNVKFKKLKSHKSFVLNSYKRKVFISRMSLKNIIKKVVFADDSKHLFIENNKHCSLLLRVFIL